MTDRQQSVAPRARRAPAKKSGVVAGLNRRKLDLGRWLKWSGLAAAACALAVAYMVVASSATFAVNRVEVEGTKRLSAERVDAIVRKAAGPRLLGADLDAVAAALRQENVVRTVSVVRVLPDTIRVRIEEREPAVVVRLKSGRIGWADADGYLLDDYVPQAGTPMPPPLTGFEDEDKSDRASADNRDRVGRYIEVREALAGSGLWDRVDEVDVRYLNDVKVQLVDNAIVVRLGDKDYRSRLQVALGLVDAVRQGDVETLARYHVPDVSRLLASADSINFIDTARSTGVTISCGEGASRAAAAAAAPSVAPQQPAEAARRSADAAPALPTAKPSAKPSAEPSAKPSAKPAQEAPAKVADMPSAKPSAKPSATPAPPAAAGGALAVKMANPATHATEPARPRRAAGERGKN